MNALKLLKLCKDHGLYCEMDGELIHLTTKKGKSYETIKVVDGLIIHSSEYGDMNLYDWLGY